MNFRGIHITLTGLAIVIGGSIGARAIAQDDPQTE